MSDRPAREAGGVDALVEQQRERLTAMGFRGALVDGAISWARKTAERQASWIRDDVHERAFYDLMEHYLALTPEWSGGTRAGIGR